MVMEPIFCVLNSERLLFCINCDGHGIFLLPFVDLSFALVISQLNVWVCHQVKVNFSSLSIDFHFIDL